MQRGTGWTLGGGRRRWQSNPQDVTPDFNDSPAAHAPSFFFYIISAVVAFSFLVSLLFCFALFLHCYCFCSCHRVVLHVLPGAACSMAYLLNYILYVNWQQQVCLRSLFVFHFHFFSFAFMAFRACLRCYQWNCDWCLFSVWRLINALASATYRKRERQRERLDWQPIKI